MRPLEQGAWPTISILSYMTRTPPACKGRPSAADELEDDVPFQPLSADAAIAPAEEMIRILSTDRDAAPPVVRTGGSTTIAPRSTMSASNTYDGPPADRGASERGESAKLPPWRR